MLTWPTSDGQTQATQETFSHLQMQAARGNMDQLADLYLSDVKVSCECRRALVRPESAAHYKTPMVLPTRRNLSTFIFEPIKAASDSDHLLEQWSTVETGHIGQI